MRRDSRLSVALHALLHMAKKEGVLTSEELARMMETNSVVMRRTMGGLRKAGIVRSEKGHGGGWTLLRNLDEVSLGDVYDALGMPTIFAMGHRTESPGCVVEQAVNQAMGEAFDAAEALLVARLARLKLSDLAADVERRHPSGSRHQRSHGSGSAKGKTAHG